MIDLDEIADILDDISQHGSTIYKEQMLKKHADVEGFKEVLKFIYDPYFTTGLKTKKLERATLSKYGTYMSPEAFMEYLRANTTGTEQDAAVANGFIYGHEDETTIWLAEAIATKDLQIGVSVTTLNKVFGQGFIPKVGIMRGMLCPDDARGIYIATEKIDGARRLIFNTADGVKIFTRSGKPDLGLLEIEEQAGLLPLGYVYDSECVAIGDFVDSIALRQASSSLLNRSGIRTGVKALVFDMVPIEEYNKGRSKLSAVGRKAMLATTLSDEASCWVMHKYFMDNSVSAVANSINALQGSYRSKMVKLLNIEALPILGIVHNKPEALELAKPIWDAGGEGIMLVDYSSAYEVSPNPRKTLLKIKATLEFECVCTGVFEGTNKYEGMMGGIYIDYKGYEVGCGSGFTDHEREFYWSHPEYIVGKLIEINSFGESTNKDGGKSLNCPIFQRIRGDGDR